MGEVVESGRREALRLLGGAAGLAVVAPALGLAGCSPRPDALPLEMPVSEFPEGRRVRLVWADGPVEVVRTGPEIRARSLRCTHQGCEVRWEPPRSRYVCPCHGGVFDADGNVVTGPPPRPLRPVPAKLVGDKVVLGG